MSLSELNPYVSTRNCSVTPRNILQDMVGALFSSLIFVGSFLFFGSLLGSRSFSFACSYTLEMVTEHSMSLLLPMAGCYALFSGLIILVRNKSKSPFWALGSGAVTFLTFNTTHDFVQRLNSLLQEWFQFEIGDFAAMALMPAIQGVILEVPLIMSAVWLINRRETHVDIPAYAPSSLKFLRFTGRRNIETRRNWSWRAQPVKPHSNAGHAKLRRCISHTLQRRSPPPDDCKFQATNPVRTALC